MTAPNVLAKRAGQERSLFHTDGVDQDVLTMALARVPAGGHVTVNTVRTYLDNAGVPPSQRGGMFARAVAAGLITPVTVTVDGMTVTVRVPSTGASAHAATVRVYRRTEVPA